MKWETVKLEDVCLKIISGGTPLTSKKSYYYPPQIPWLKTAEVNYCRIWKTENMISEEGLNNSSAKLIPENSVIVAMYGQGDTAGRVAINKIPLATNQACCNLIINPNIADYRYVYYILSVMYEHLIVLKSGGAQPNLNAKLIKNFEIKIPELKVQKTISDVLSAYDDLIENNQKQIKLLEEAAQRLYKEWFVDLHFPGCENTPVVDGVPEGWAKGILEDIAKFQRGKTITKADIKDGKVPVIAGGLKPAYYHNKANTTAPVITVSGSGVNAGYTSLHNVDIFASDCSYVDANTSQYIFFVYCFLKENSSQLNMLQKGSAQPHVYARDINSISIVIPTDKILKEYCNFIAKYFEKIKVLTLQIENLSQVRNHLIQKLFNDELDV